jgi:hypothetical protein
MGETPSPNGNDSTSRVVDSNPSLADGIRSKTPAIMLHRRMRVNRTFARPTATFLVERISGRGEYGFMLTAIDGQVSGGGHDRFRIKIWDEETGVVIYDNQTGTDDNAGLNDSTIIRGGSIVIHTQPTG